MQGQYPNQISYATKYNPQYQEQVISCWAVSQWVTENLPHNIADYFQGYWLLSTIRWLAIISLKTSHTKVSLT